MMRYAHRLASLLAITLSIGLWGPLGLSGSVADAATDEEIVTCYQAYSSAYFCDTVGNCSMKHKIGPITLRFTERCINELIKCQMFLEADGDDVAKCMGKAQIKCERSAEELQLHALRFTEQRQQVVDDCSGLDFISEVLGAVDGLGFGGNASTCAGIGQPLLSVDNLTECSDAWLLCRYEQLVALLVPRAAELFQAAGWDDPFAVYGCMTPAIPGDATGMDRKDLTRCEKDLLKRTKQFMRRKLINMEECVFELTRCEFDKAGPDCLAEAQFLCEKEIDRIGKQYAKYIFKMTDKCTRASLAELRDGLGLAAPGHACQSASTATQLTNCIAQEVSCWVDEVVGFLVPRTSELVNAAGLANEFPCLP